MLLGLLRLFHLRAIMPRRFPLLLFGLQMWQYSCVGRAKRTCWNTEHFYLVCCAKGATTDPAGDPCFPEDVAVDADGIDVRWECCGDDPQILVYAPMKTATTYLLHMLEDSNLLVTREHDHAMAAHILKRMTPPCYVITSARNLYTRNPSHYFHTAVPSHHNIPRLRFRHGPLFKPVVMHTGRWKTEMHFLDAAAPAIRADFRDANLATSRHHMLEWFSWFQQITGADIGNAFIHRRFAKHVVINASAEHCHCNVLVLCYEHSRYWPFAMRYFLPQAELKPERVNDAASMPFKSMYRRFVSGGRYSANETSLMCASDTMALPFYSGRCVKHGGRWHIAPGVRGSPLPPLAGQRRTPTHPPALPESSIVAAAAVDHQRASRHVNEMEPVGGRAGKGGGEDRVGESGHGPAVRVSSSTSVWNGGPARLIPDGSQTKAATSVSTSAPEETPSWCARGKKAGSVCCDSSCDVCGGPTCSGSCCGGAVLRQGRMCQKDTDVTCLIPVGLFASVQLER